MKKLTVILGAGASSSLNSNPKPQDKQEFRPPLTSDVFSIASPFALILHKYPLAETLASHINLQLRQNKEGLGLEQILKVYEDRLSKGEDSHITRQFLQIPLYLNDLFGEVSQHFTHQPDEYNTLVNQILDKTEDVLFLTLNYDTLLELPLSRWFDIDFSKVSDYISNSKWKFVKLHGSINWYRKFINYQVSELNDKDYFTKLRLQKLPLSLDNSYEMISIPGHQQKYINSVPVYPAITVPVDGKYDLNCPPEMIEIARQFLADCHNYLIIGTSGNDQDLLDLLKNYVRSANVILVGREEESTAKTKKKFMDVVPQFQNSITAYHDSRGFSMFVDSGKFDDFLDSLS